MNRIVILLIIILTLLISSACSTKSNKYYAVKNHSPRISSLGFHIYPPPGINWYEKHLNNSLYYFKGTTPATYALTTTATELVFQNPFTWKEDFLEFVKLQKALPEKPSSRYRDCSIDYSVEEILSSMCVRYYNKYNDYEDKGKGIYDFVRVINKGLVCIHPNSYRVGIDINYLEKSIPAADNPSFRDEGEKFLNSLSFLTQPQ